MAFGFDNVKEESSKKQYLREAGLHENAKFIGLTYGATAEYEYFDIELEVDGKTFRERTFGPDINRVFVKANWENGKQVGMETKEQAYSRSEMEVSTKLLHLAACFVDKQTAIKKVTGLKTLKEFVDAVSKLIGQPKNTINFLTIWKNSDKNERSNLIIAERIKWCEPYVEGTAPGIKLTRYQEEKQMFEKYPYVAKTSDGPAVKNAEALEEVTSDVAGDLPF